MRLTMKPGHSAQRTGVLRIAWAKLVATRSVSWEVSSPSTTSTSRMSGGGREEVEADHLVRPAGGVADLGDRQPAGVGGQHGVAGRGGVELGEHRVLDLHAVGDGLDHEVDVAEAVVGGGAGDQRERGLDLGVALAGGELLLGDELGDLALGHLAGRRQPRLEARVVDVLEHDGDAGGGDDLGDLPAPAHDGGFEDEHAATLPALSRTGSRPCARSRSGSGCAAARRSWRGG